MYEPVLQEYARRIAASHIRRISNRLCREAVASYADPVVRGAYVVHYLPAYAFFWEHLLRWAGPMLAGARTITSLGSGPGSEIFGLWSHRACGRGGTCPHGPSQTGPDMLRIHRVEREQAWSEDFAALAERAGLARDPRTPVTTHHESYETHAFAGGSVFCSFLFSELVGAAAKTNLLTTFSAWRPSSVLIVDRFGEVLQRGGLWSLACAWARRDGHYEATLVRPPERTCPLRNRIPIAYRRHFYDASEPRFHPIERHRWLGIALARR